MWYRFAYCPPEAGKSARGGQAPRNEALFVSANVNNMRRELTRKAVHSFGCVAAFVAYCLPPLVVVCVSVCVIVLYALSEWMRCRGRSLPISTRLTNLCLRPSEKGRPALGPIYLGFGFMLSFVLFAPQAALAANVLSCLLDSVAGLAGVGFGRTPIPFSPAKTVEGSVSALLVGLPVGTILTLSPKGALASVVAVLVESLPLGNLDNLLIPLATGCFLTAVLY